MCVRGHLVDTSLSTEKMGGDPLLMLQLCHLQRLFPCDPLLVLANSSTGLILHLLQHVHVAFEVSDFSDVTLGQSQQTQARHLLEPKKGRHVSGTRV